MAWDVIEAKKNGTGANGIQSAISDWETANSPTSIDQISTTSIGPNRVSIQIVYTA